VIRLLFTEGEIGGTPRMSFVLHRVEDELAMKQYPLADDLHGLKPRCRPTLLKAVVQ
jgi:hypothetical protein